MLVVSDATPFNILIRAELSHLLPTLFGRVVVPPAVQRELTHPSTPEVIHRWLATAPPWLEIRAPAHVIEHGPRGRGEREAISLAQELHADLLLVDDNAARKAAASLGIAITGTLGVLTRAADGGLIDLRSAVVRVRAVGLFLSDDLVEQTFRSRGERSA